MGKGGVRICSGLAGGLAIAVSFGTSIAPGSPQLARIAYESNGRVFTIAADGSDRIKLTGGVKPHRYGYGDHAPDYSPDGSRLTFYRAIRVHRFGVRTRIEVMNANGRNRHALSLSGARRYELDPAWAPDGRHLAFTRYAQSDRSFTSSIVVMRDDGTHRRTLERISLGPHSHRLIYVGEATWAPDGEHLIFTRTRLDHQAFFRPSLISITKHGTDEKLVARDAGSASFSPDGSRIAFASVKDRHGSECGEDECYYNGEIYVADADGTHPERLTGTAIDEAQPDWSADGKHIVFSSHREAHGADRPPQLFSVTPTGTCRIRLTHRRAGGSAPDLEPNAALSSDPGSCP